MALNLNRAIIVGRLGADPEAPTPTMVRCSVATSESWKDKQTGERQERTQWHRVVIFNEVAGKFLRDYAHKGDTVCIEGQIETRKYADRDGSDRYTTEIVVPRFGGSVQIMSSQGGPGPFEDMRTASAQTPGERDDRRSAQVKPEAKPSSRGRIDLDDEIPFAAEWR